MQSILLRPLPHFISLALRPGLDSIWYGHHLSWDLRWRLLAFQPLHVLSNITIVLPNYLSLPFTVDYIPVEPDREVHVLVFRPSLKDADKRKKVETAKPTFPALLYPLHIYCHGGGFLGGYPESEAIFCSYLAASTGAIVVSLYYRIAPVHPFPAAIDDVDAAVAWLRKNAANWYEADPNLITVSGSSAGGALMLSATQAQAHSPINVAAEKGEDVSLFKAYIGFYPPVDLRPAPWEKPKPKLTGDKVPPDPFTWLQPLFDSYAAPRKADMGHSPPMNPCLADVATLPERMLIVIAGIDVLPKELFDFVERVNREDEVSGNITSRRAEALYLENMFHGFMEVPNWILPWSKRKVAFDKAVSLIRDAHRDHGWERKA